MRRWEYGQLFVSGLTDVTNTGPDAHAKVVSQWGFGRSTDLAGFTWALAAPNPAFPVSPATSNNDEYMYTATLPLALGDYSYAYRFSSDGGATWLNCDLDGATIPSEFSTAQEGLMTVAP